MVIAPQPEHEQARIEALRRYEILDTDSEAPFDDLVQLAAQVCQVPIALISLIDPLHQWFKAKTGAGVCQTPPDIALCAHAILQRDIFEVPDALGDERFANNPLVTGESHIRFMPACLSSTGTGMPSVRCASSTGSRSGCHGSRNRR